MHGGWMLVFKLKAFARFQRRERIGDAALLGAVETIESGLVDADLGGGLIKQRVARRGKGKRGGYRTVIAYRRGTRSVFLLGFAKSDRDNIGDEELDYLRDRAKALLNLNEAAVARLITDGDLMEVKDDEGNEDA